MTSQTKTLRTFELIAVTLTALGKFLFMDYLNWRLPFVIAAILFWGGYIIWTSRRNPEVLKAWGFRTDNFNSVLKLVLPFAIVSLVIFVIVGLARGSINTTWHILPILISYPIWGTIQQFLIIALVAGNLRAFNVSKPLILILTAVLFSVVHFPSVWLMAGTFVLALFYTWIYLKKQNLYVLGLFHGWLGAFFYYLVINQDPFADIFLKYF
ncbi:CPBP family glutamic-type intramembrane protease [Winogradskyella sp. 3972H.M.0a.05]|uniref:CPBP family glutamic-type intramembrane protease n=1 Tax=Winogradskyella sp. 3972H.M.0a.05 TaxID=2950277 RepID=UPI0033994E60